MCFTIIFLLLNFNIHSKDRKPAQYTDQIQIVSNSLVKKTKNEKIKIMNEFMLWMESNNAMQIKQIVNTDIDSDLKEKITENRMVYFNLKPLKDLFLDNDKFPDKSQCSKLISDIKYNDKVGKPEADTSLSPRAKNLITLLSNFCL